MYVIHIIHWPFCLICWFVLVSSNYLNFTSHTDTVGYCYVCFYDLWLVLFLEEQWTT